MIRAHVDTPWGSNAEGYVPELAIDPAFTGLIKGWADITGKEGAEVPPGVRLYGGNYAKATGIEPDHSVGRLGGSGDPDYLSIEIKVEDESTLQAIDQDQRYWVYFSEVIAEGGPVTAAAAYKPKTEPCTANEWGQLRSRLATRGVPQWWIDLNLGTANDRVRGVNDFNMRQGYLLNQIGNPGAGTVDIPPLVTFLQDEGWRCDVMGGRLVVFIEMDGEQNILVITEAEFLDCAAHATNRPSALWADIHDFAVAGGYC